MVAPAVDLDFGDVKKLLMRDGMSNNKADRAIAQYAEYLRKVRDEGYRGSPGKLADKAWHAHILLTKKYHEDCQKLLGRYLHHNPNLEPKAELNGQPCALEDGCSCDDDADCEDCSCDLDIDDCAGDGFSQAMANCDCDCDGLCDCD